MGGAGSALGVGQAHVNMEIDCILGPKKRANAIKLWPYGRLIRLSFFRLHGGIRSKEFYAKYDLAYPDFTVRPALVPPRYKLRHEYKFWYGNHDSASW